MATAPKAATKAAPEAQQQAPAAPKKSKKKLVLFMLILLLLLGAGGGAAWVMLGQEEIDPNAPQVVKQAPPQPPVFLVIDPFTVNLQPDGAGEQFLQVSFSLQVTDQKEVDVIKLYLPQVRSRLLLMLSGKKASQISTLEGKKQLAEDILAQVNQPFAPGIAPQTVKNVFFTSFVIQ